MGDRTEVRTQTVWRDSEDIIHADLKPQADVGLDDAREALEAIRGLSGGQRRRVLVDLREIRSMSREARVFFAGPVTAEVELAVALLVASPLAAAIGTFFMGLNKPVIPTRLFTAEDEALAWLKGVGA